MSSETQFIFNFTKFQQDQEEETVNQEGWKTSILGWLRKQHNYKDSPKLHVTYNSLT